MRIRNLLFPLACVSAYSWGQASSELTARELFFKPVEIVAKKNPNATRPKVAKPTPKVEAKEIRTGNEVKLVTEDYSGPRPLGLRYTILRVADGRKRPVAVDTTFFSGNGVKVRVESNEDGYLYVYSRKSDGNWVVLFPTSEIRGGDNKISAGDQYDLPSTEYQWTMVNQKGEERLYVVLSRKPIAELDKPLYNLQSPQRVMLATKAPTVDDRLVAQVQQSLNSRDLVLEKVQTSDEDELAGYAVNKSGLTDAMVAADIRLRHE